MPKEHLITIKDAATKSGITEESIRTYIRSGKLRGQKKNYFLWDEWFVSSRELERFLQEKIKDKRQIQSVFNNLVEEDSPQADDATAVESRRIALESNFFSAPNSVQSTFHTPKENVSSNPDVLAQKNQDEIAPEDFLAPVDRQFIAEESESEASPDNDHWTSNPDKVFPDYDLQQDRYEHQSPTHNSEGFATHTELHGDATELADEATDSFLTLLEPGAGAKERGHENQEESWPHNFRHRAKTVAEEFLGPLLHRLEVQAMVIREKDLLIAEQAAQLRLLSDFQRQRQEDQEKLTVKEKELNELRESVAVERRQTLAEITNWQTKQSESEAKRIESEAKRIESEAKRLETETAMKQLAAEKQSQLERIQLEKDTELTRLAKQKEDEIRAILEQKIRQEMELRSLEGQRTQWEEQLQLLNTRVQEISTELSEVRNRRWWERLFKSS